MAGIVSDEYGDGGSGAAAVDPKVQEQQQPLKIFWKDFEREDGNPVQAPSSGSRAAAGILPNEHGDGGSDAAVLELESSGRRQPSKMMSPRIYCFLEMLITFPN